MGKFTFFHFRNALMEEIEVDFLDGVPMVEGPNLQPKGGASAVLTEEGQFALAICSENDNFCYKRGRLQALRNLDEHKFAGDLDDLTSFPRAFIRKILLSYASSIINHMGKDGKIVLAVKRAGGLLDPSFPAL